MEHITGPDFPTKAIILGRAGIRSAYATGKGRLTLRARTHFEEFGQNRTRIIVTEIPYQVNKRMLIKNMADQVNEKRLDGISDIRDESDRTGLARLVEPMALAAAAAGADGVMVEVHNDPPHALCDGAQALTPEQFAQTARSIRRIREALAE